MWKEMRILILVLRKRKLTGDIFSNILIQTWPLILDFRVEFLLDFDFVFDLDFGFDLGF